MLRAVFQSFADKRTMRVWVGEPVRGLDAGAARLALRRLLVPDAATSLQELRVPPGNHLERLRGDRRGQWSIRVNGRWRLCFTWSDCGPADVEFVDYH